MLYEGNETFDIQLTTPVNVTLADGTNTVTIIDDEVQPTITIADISVLMVNLMR